MRDKTRVRFIVTSVIVITLVVLGFGAWRTVERMRDCMSLNHGLPYCLIVWGGR